MPYEGFCGILTMQMYSPLYFRPVTFLLWSIEWLISLCLLGKNINMSGRNFPQGTISDMVSDASEGISFVCNNAVSYGGDPNK